MTSVRTEIGRAAHNGFERRTWPSPTVLHLPAFSEQTRQVIAHVSVVVSKQNALPALPGVFPRDRERRKRGGRRNPGQRLLYESRDAMGRGDVSRLGPHTIWWEVRRSQRNRHAERRALTHTTLHVDFTADEAHELVRAPRRARSPSLRDFAPWPPRCDGSVRRGAADPWRRCQCPCRARSARPRRLPVPPARRWIPRMCT